MAFLIISIFIAFFTAQFQVFAVAGYGVTLTDLLLAALYALAVKKVVWDGAELRIAKSAAMYFLGGMAGAILLSAFAPLFLSASGDSLLQYMKTAPHMLFLMLFAFVCAAFDIDYIVWGNAVRTWLILSLLINLFGVYQIVARAYELPLAWINYSNVSMLGRDNYDSLDQVAQLSLKYKNFYRATSFFSEPSTLATFNLYIISFILIPYLQRNKPYFKSKALTASIFIIALGTTFLTFSLTAMTGVGLILLIIFLIEKRKRLKLFATTLIISAFLIITVDSIVKSYAEISVMELFGDRVSGIMSLLEGRNRFVAGESFSTRMGNADQTMMIWEDYPVTGIGLGLTDSYPHTDIAFSDIGFLGFMAETGIIGAAALAGMFISLIMISISFLRDKEKMKELEPEAQTLSGALMYIMLVLTMVNFVVGNNVVGIGLWIPVSLVFGVMNKNLLAFGFKSWTLKFSDVPFKNKLSKRLDNYLIGRS